MIVMLNFLQFHACYNYKDKLKFEACLAGRIVRNARTVGYRILRINTNLVGSFTCSLPILETEKVVG